MAKMALFMEVNCGIGFAISSLVFSLTAQFHKSRNKKTPVALLREFLIFGCGGMHPSLLAIIAPAPCSTKISSYRRQWRTISQRSVGTYAINSPREKTELKIHQKVPYRLMTIHESKGREFAAVAVIGLREGSMPHFKARPPEAVDAERRQFYVAVTRAEKLLMYVYDRDRYRNPPSRFLGEDGVGMV